MTTPGQRVSGLSRRQFLAAAGAVAATPAFLNARLPQTAPGPGLTVRDVMTRVNDALAGVVPANPVDGLKAGREDLRVTGIAVTALATAEIVRQAKARGHNLIITFEPTFYARGDQPSPPNRAADTVFAAKRDLIAARDVAVWRLHDRWLVRRPDPMIAGLVEALEWQRFHDVASPDRVTVPATTLRDLVAHVQRQLGARALRVVGAPDTRVARVILSPGASPAAATIGNLATADVILAGEPREWEGVEYVQDTITAGGAKGMILMGRVLSEEPGMRVLARWLPTVLPGLPIEWIGGGDPYWHVDANRSGRIA